MGDARESKPTPDAKSSGTDVKPLVQATGGLNKQAPNAHNPVRAVQLLFRNAIVVSDAALAETGARKLVGAALAASEVAASLREAAQLMRGHGEVVSLGASAAAVITRAHQLEAELAQSDAQSAADDLATATRAFEAAAPAAVHGGRQAEHAASLRPLTNDENIELATLALGAAKERLHAFRSMGGGEAEFRGQAIALCESIVIHLARARDCALKIEDRRIRNTLTASVAGVSADLEYVNALLAEIPRQRWDRSFANAFDEEALLRQAVGLPPAPRSYTGTINPDDAKNAVAGIANGAAASAGTFDIQDIQDPAAAVQSIGIGIGEMYERQLAAVGNLRSDLQETEAPKEHSWLQAILITAVKTAIVVATDGIADGVSEKLGQYFEARDVGKLGSALEHLSSSEREIVEDQLKKLPHAGRKIMMKTAKEGLLQAIKEPAIKALEGEPPVTHAAWSLDAFEQSQQAVLRDAKQTSENRFAVISNALAQLDMETLKALAATFNGPVALLARERQYRASAFAWQNFKAQAEAGVYKKGHKSNSGDAKAGSDEQDSSGGAKVGCSGEVGVLDVLATVDSDPAKRDIRLSRLTLNGVEPTMRKYFRAQRFAIADVLLNRDFQVQWSELYGFNVQFAIGPDGRLRTEGISKRDMRLLKVYASGDSVRGANAFAAMDGEYDHVPDSKAMHVLHTFMNRLMQLTTTDLEG